MDLWLDDATSATLDARGFGLLPAPGPAGSDRAIPRPERLADGTPTVPHSTAPPPAVETTPAPSWNPEPPARRAITVTVPVPPWHAVLALAVLACAGLALAAWAL